MIGLGPGGQAVAEELARAGIPVVGVDSGLVGGECPYWGCVPSKRMARAAAAIGEARRIDGLAGRASVTPDWAPVHAWIADQATDHWDDRVAVERLEGLGGTFLRGRGRLTGPRTVEVEAPDGTTTTVTASRAVVVATGSAPAVPPIDGLAGTPYWTNHEFIESPTLPASVVVLGGGAIGCELVAGDGALRVRRDARRAGAAPARPRGARGRRAARRGVRSRGDRGAHRGRSHRRPVRRRRVHRDARRRLRGLRREAARGDRAPRRPGSCRSRRGRHRPGRPQRPGRRPAAGARRRRAGRRRLRDRRHHREGRLHARGGAPGASGDRGAARRRAGEQPDHRAAARDVHRPGDRRGRPHRGAGARAGPRRAGGDGDAGAALRRAAGSTARATTASSPSSRAAAGSSVRPARDRPAARCSARCPWPCRPASRSPTCGARSGPTRRCTAASSTCSRSSTLD